MAAREDFGRKAQVRYLDVARDPAQLKKMLELSRGVRQVPVIVEDDRVTVGYGGT